MRCFVLYQASGLLLTLAALAPAGATIIAAGKLQMCEQSESSTNCKDKLLVSMSLQGMEDEQEHLTIGQACVQQKSGGCTPHKGTQLYHHLIVGVRKSAVRIRYPVEYRYSYNDNPHEVVMCGVDLTDIYPVLKFKRDLTGKALDKETQGSCKTGAKRFTTVAVTASAEKYECRDSNAEEKVSCGWQYPPSYPTARKPWSDRKKHTIKGSQGFCCKCSVGNYLGLGKTEDCDNALCEKTKSRGHLTCDAFGSSTGATAHCLRQSALWYDAFQPKAPSVHFEIDVTIRKCHDAACTTSDNTTIRVGPQKTTGRDPSTGSTAEFTGESTTHDNPSFASKLLLRPRCDSQHAAQCDHEPKLKDAERWLLLDKTKFTADGTQCNRIGVGPEAFTGQAHRCEKAYGSCLGAKYSGGKLLDSGKVRDYYDYAKAQEAHGVKTYFVKDQVQDAKMLLSDALAGRSGDGETYLAYSTDRFQSSSVTLTLRGDLIRYTRTVATGKITKVVTHKFEAGQTGSFEVTVKNAGKTLAGQFMVRVDKCVLVSSNGTHGTKNIIGNGIKEFSAKPTPTLQPNTSAVVKFDLQVSSPKAKEYCCKVIVVSGVAHVQDQRDLCWGTSATVHVQLSGEACDPTKQKCSSDNFTTASAHWYPDCAFNCGTLLLGTYKPWCVLKGMLTPGDPCHGVNFNSVIVMVGGVVLLLVTCCCCYCWCKVCGPICSCCRKCTECLGITGEKAHTRRSAPSGNGKFERYEDDAEPQAHGGRKGGQQHQGKGGGASSYEMEEQLTSREAQLDRRELNSRQAELDMREQEMNERSARRRAKERQLQGASELLRHASAPAVDLVYAVEQEQFHSAPPQQYAQPALSRGASMPARAPPQGMFQSAGPQPPPRKQYTVQHKAHAYEAFEAAELAHQRSVPPPADPAHATYDADVYELSRGVSCPAGGGQQHGMPPARVRGLASSETVGGAAHADLARVSQFTDDGR